MPNLNVGLGVALCLTHPVQGAKNAEFYDENENWWGEEDNELNIALELDSYDSGCARYATGYSNVAFSCNGKCSRSTYTTKKNVLPNGSYFINNSDDKVYVCSVDGWVECAENTTGDYEMLNPFTVYLYDGDSSYAATGYKEFEITRTGVVHDPASFCGAPYYHLNITTQSGIWYDDTARGMWRTYTENNQTITEYYYDACAENYYLHNFGTTGTTRGTSCASCPTIAYGTATTTAWNSASKCTITCDSGYIASGQECIERDNAGYNPGNYGGDECDTDCPECPENALCNGQYVYCHAGNYVYTPWDGTATCKDCPGEWGMTPAYYTSSLTDCSGVNGDNSGSFDWGQGYATTTDCLWTDYSNDNDTVCSEFMGSDEKGQYEYRYDDGDWYECIYEE